MTYTYAYTLINPRFQEQAKELTNTPTLGVEMTIPELASLCVLGNLDPQHSGGDPNTAAIEAALTHPLPPAGAALATVRPDADAFGAMAILTLRQEGVEITRAVLARVQEIAEADKNPPRPRAGGEVTALQALGAVTFNHQIPVPDRVTRVREFLLTGSFAGQEEATAQVMRERAELAKVVPDVTLAAGGRIAVVESPARGAMTAGYTKCDVVVAANPQFRVQGGEPHLKYTVGQRQPGAVDLVSAVAELKELEPGWGGSPTVIGSPQGVGSRLSLEQVVEVVARHLR